MIAKQLSNSLCNQTNFNHAEAFIKIKLSHMNHHKINRRDFLRNSSMLLAMSALHPYVSNANTRRVALIGTGWYGKSDLFRLMQVAPVDVVALCDVDKHQLDAAADMVGQRQQN